MKPSRTPRQQTRRKRNERAFRFCGGFLKKARIDAGISQLQLAMRLNQSKGYVNRIEQGRRRIGVVEFMDFLEAVGKSASEATRELMREFPDLFGGCKDSEVSK